MEVSSGFFYIPCCSFVRKWDLTIQILQMVLTIQEKTSKNATIYDKLSQARGAKKPKRCLNKYVLAYGPKNSPDLSYLEVFRGLSVVKSFSVARSLSSEEIGSLEKPIAAFSRNYRKHPELNQQIS